MKLRTFHLALCLVSATSAFSIAPSRVTSTFKRTATHPAKSLSLFPVKKQARESYAPLAATAALSQPEEKSEGKGLFTFKTKYGYLNPFAIYYGFVSIFFGIPWYFALKFSQLFYWITGGRFDKLRLLPVFFSTCWGNLLLRFTRSYPKVENYEILEKFYKEGRAAMFVANHNSWMDIPFVGVCVGWRNYKIISKVELLKVPILGTSISVGGHVVVDRQSRKSQMKTLKSGMKCLQDGVHLCAFPEGTRSRDGRLLPFKNGVYKMASKVGAPIIPFSIVGAGDAHPPTWMFPRKPSHSVCKVVIHEPIESEGRSEEELADMVRKAVISGLPENQRPLDE